MEAYEIDALWIVIVGFVMAFTAAFTIGANDVANSFGTSVGSKVLTVKQACILGVICETAGSILLGAEVTAAIGSEIMNEAVYNGTEKQIMLGSLATLGKPFPFGTSSTFHPFVGASGAWQLIATFFRLPISTTHGVVGSIIGFNLVAKGLPAVKWM
ncbi:unnamed protein product, partial [Darwinula stevensoni]